MTASDPCFLSVPEAAALIAAKRLSPVELVRAYLGFAVGRAAPEKISISAKESPSLFEGDQRFESALLQR